MSVQGGKNAIGSENKSRGVRRRCKEVSNLLHQFASKKVVEDFSWAAAITETKGAVLGLIENGNKFLMRRRNDRLTVKIRWLEISGRSWTILWND